MFKLRNQPVRNWPPLISIPAPVIYVFLSLTKNSIADAINSISDKEKNALILITGSLYFCGEVLNMN